MRLIPQSILNGQARLTYAPRAVDDKGTAWVLPDTLMQFRQDVLAALEQPSERGVGQVPLPPLMGELSRASGNYRLPQIRLSRLTK